MTITLRPMTQDEYDRLSPAVIDSFAAELLAAGHATSPEDARIKTLAQIEQLLPDAGDGCAAGEWNPWARPVQQQPAEDRTL